MEAKFLFLTSFSKMALFVFCAFFFLAVSAASATEDKNILNFPGVKLDDHNIVRCETEGQEEWKILEQGTVSAKGKPLRVVERELTYPTTGTGKPVITCIRVIDKIGDGHGGLPEIVSGGLQQHYVTIRFVSQRGRGFKFSVEVWGKEEQ